MRYFPVPMAGQPHVSDVPITPLVQEWIDGNQLFYTVMGFNPPWIAYFAVEDEVIVGTCAFKGKPRNGLVEIAYSTHAGMEGRGIATRMAQELIRIARATDLQVRIIAQTLPELNASTRVLTKCGFTQVRDALDDEVGKVWEWELIVD